MSKSVTVTANHLRGQFLLPQIHAVIKWIGLFIVLTEELLSTLSVPLLSLGISASLFDFYQGGTLSTNPTFSAIWAAIQAVSIDAQIAYTWFKARRSLEHHKFFSFMGFLIIGGTIGFVAWAGGTLQGIALSAPKADTTPHSVTVTVRGPYGSYPVQGMTTMVTDTTADETTKYADTLAQFGIDAKALVGIRMGVSIVLLAVAGWTRKMVKELDEIEGVTTDENEIENQSVLRRFFNWLFRPFIAFFSWIKKVTNPEKRAAKKEEKRQQKIQKNLARNAPKNQPENTQKIAENPEGKTRKNQPVSEVENILKMVDENRSVNLPESDDLPATHKANFPVKSQPENTPFPSQAGYEIYELSPAPVDPLFNFSEQELQDWTAGPVPAPRQPAEVAQTETAPLNAVNPTPDDDPTTQTTRQPAPEAAPEPAQGWTDNVRGTTPDQPTNSAPVAPEGGTRRLIGMTLAEAVKLPVCQKKNIKVSDLRRAVLDGQVKEKLDGSVTKNAVENWAKSYTPGDKKQTRKTIEISSRNPQKTLEKAG